MSIAEDSTDGFFDSPDTSEKKHGALEEEDNNVLVGVEKEDHNLAMAFQLSILAPGPGKARVIKSVVPSPRNTCSSGDQINTGQRVRYGRMEI